MSKQIDALKLALETLEYWHVRDEFSTQTSKAITAIKEALAEQPAQDQGQSCYCPNCEALSKELAALKAQQQEPWKCTCGANLYIDTDGKPRSTAASKPLTDAQIGAVAADIWGSVLIAPQSYQTFARAIEREHGIKALAEQPAQQPVWPEHELRNAIGLMRQQDEQNGFGNFAVAIKALEGLLEAPQPAQQEPIAWMKDCADFWEHYTYISEASQENYKAEAQMWVEKLRTSPPASKPLPFNKEDMEGLDVNQRLGFKLGWKSAEEAHGIKE